MSWTPYLWCWLPAGHPVSLVSLAGQPLSWAASLVAPADQPLSLAAPAGQHVSLVPPVPVASQSPQRHQSSSMSPRRCQLASEHSCWRWPAIKSRHCPTQPPPQSSSPWYAVCPSCGVDLMDCPNPTHGRPSEGAGRGRYGLVPQSNHVIGKIELTGEAKPPPL